MKLSVVIPTCNRPSALAECLSALAREIGVSVDTQVLVVDDGSTAPCRSRNRDLCGRRGFQYMGNSLGKGPAGARNAGIGRSSGEWIAFLDDDVCVRSGWYAALMSACSKRNREVVGVEGATFAGGEGLWDREVENLNGGLYLSCNIVYRRAALEEAGGFSSLFKGPYCEDHELAARMLRRGRIEFAPAMAVTHQPRRVRLMRYILGSPGRSALALRSEYLFWQLQRDRYHLFRRTASFWHTILRLATRQAWISLRRRRLRDLARHPLQAALLIAAELVEQVSALLLIPRFMIDYIKDSPLVELPGSSLSKSASMWGLQPQAVVPILRARTRIAAALFFGSVRRPVYSIGANLRTLSSRSTLDGLRLFLRVDDVFLDRAQDVQRLCEVMTAARVPFLASVTADDLTGPEGPGYSNRMEASGGMVGLHGFSHQGEFGPFASELLQMTVPELEARLEKVAERLPAGRLPRVLVPPFNAIAWDQILHLSRFFRVITGGPETLRFAHRWIGPLAVGRAGWYFPSLHPFYGSARELIKEGGMRALTQGKGLAAVTLHMPEEARDGFAALRRFVELHRDRFTPWTVLTHH